MRWWPASGWRQFSMGVSMGKSSAPPRIDWPALARGGAVGSGLLRFGATPAQVARRAGGMVYLATPYSREVVDSAGRWRLERSIDMALRAAQAAAELAALRVTAVSPVVLSAEMCAARDLRPGAGAEIDPLDQRFWGAWCAPILRASCAVVVPQIEGWQCSTGIWREVFWALERNMPVFIYAEGV